MNLPLAKSQGHTIEQWETWDGRWQLINGVVYEMTPSLSLEHKEGSSNPRFSSSRPNSHWPCRGPVCA